MAETKPELITPAWRMKMLNQACDAGLLVAHEGRNVKPTGCATSCTSQAKWLQMVLHGLSGFDTKWNCCRLASLQQGKRGRLLEADRDSLPS